MGSKVHELCPGQIKSIDNTTQVQACTQHLSKGSYILLSGEGEGMLTVKMALNCTLVILKVCCYISIA